jgi:acetylxylan esterase
MTRKSTTVGLLTGALALVASSSSWAASLQQVNNWGNTGLPADVAMYAYVPDKVAAKPPVLALIHYCGGSAQAVFGQAQGGGLIKAADQYGFVLVVPSNANASGANGRCWDVTSKKAQTRDGGGDPHAINQMVKFALTQYQGNPERVYATGDSSGGMVTQLLLALYPDVYKAGSAFAGVPAGCTNAFDGAGLCGLGAQTAQQWGDRARGMYVGYAGHRPRVQLFHGDKDDTIRFPNHGEAIKEWTNVLGLMTNPTTTQMGLTLGNHQATRQSWKNDCGYVALDAFTSVGGDHGPSDALFEAEYVVPFLGLDKTGAVDPEIEQCKAGSGGGGAGGGGGGGAGGAGGMTGTAGAGGAPGSGGGGAAGSGGTFGLAGSPPGTNFGGFGGEPTGGVGGAAGSAGASGTPSGGSAMAPGPTNGSPALVSDSSGCSLRGGAARPGSVSGLGLALGLAAFACRRRRAG